MPHWEYNYKIPEEKEDITVIPIYLLTPGGLERIASKEVKSLIGKVDYVERGLIKTHGDIRDLIRLNIWGRTITRVLLGLCEGEFKSLNDILNQISNVNFKLFFKDNYTFAVRCSRAGQHDFTSIEAASKVGSIINDSLSKAGMNVKVDLENPTVEFLLRIHENYFHFGINTSGEGLNKRGYRVYSHPAALNPVIAAGMILTLEWDGKPILIDPMCGGCTIPIEGVMTALNYAPGLYRAYHKIIDLPMVDREEYIRYREEAIKSRKHVKHEISYAVDISKKHINGGIRNAESAGVKSYIRFITGDSRRLNKYIEYDNYVFAFNPPYGIRMTRREAIPILYRETLESLYNVGAKSGIIITPETNLLTKLARNVGFRIKQIFNVTHGGLKTFIHVLVCD